MVVAVFEVVQGGGGCIRGGDVVVVAVFEVVQGGGGCI